MNTRFLATLLVAASLTITSAAHAGSSASAAKKGTPVGYANIDAAGTVLSFGNLALEVQVLERVVLCVHGEAVLVRVGRDPVRHGPGSELGDVP